jgi:Nickel/cobalt transporter regulator
MKKFLAGLLVAATALTPLTAAYAQREGRENVRMEGAERAPRGPEIRQWDRRESVAPEVRAERQQRRAERAQQRGMAPVDTAQRRGDIQTRNREVYTDPNRGQRRDGWQGERRDARQGDGNRDGRVDRQWDRNRDGQVDRGWDRNNNGRIDRQWDRNRNGELDRRWDQNNNDRLDRRYDRNRDGNLDRRWDQNRDGRADRYGNNRGWDNRGYENRRYDNRSWNRSWRNDRRYDWSGYRNQYRDHYRLGRYYAPYRDHRYSRFSIGIRIGSPFYSNRYWINDPWRYRLPDVHGPYRWVRYYDDVLLVDIYSGEVVDVIHNFFW